MKETNVITIVSLISVSILVLIIMSVRHKNAMDRIDAVHSYRMKMLHDCTMGEYYTLPSLDDMMADKKTWSMEVLRKGPVFDKLKSKKALDRLEGIK